MDHVTTEIQRKALLVMTGDESVTSYLDKHDGSSNVYELNGTKYTLSGSYLRSHDFTDFTRVTKIGDEKRVLFNLAATGLSDVFQVPDLDVAMLHSTVHELTAMVSALSVPEASMDSFTITLAKDRFHQYICKLFLFYSNFLISNF